MSRLVVVSNRLADPRKAAAGGLAVALGETLNRTGGMWFGWSGAIAPSDAPPQAEAEVHHAGSMSLATVDLTQEEHDSYYLGYSNNVLWPVFHYRLDLANFDAGYLEGYRRVNKKFAALLKPLLRPDDIVWVHDYHLIPLAAELRALGCRQRIGFFLHIPFPPQLIMAAVPRHDRLARTFFDYDVVGLQSEADSVHFSRYVQSELGADALDGRADTYRLGERTLLAKAFPIGIDVDEFAALTHGKEAVETCATMRREYQERRLVIGVDRLDYSKGIPHRVRAFRELLQDYPEMRGSATLVQIASPTRETVDAYADIRQELESLCGAINGDYGDLAWMPVRYIHRTVARKRIPGVYRASRVGLVTPLRDGMNLVAKEYIAAQDPGDPGVLVLSRFAGASEQLQEALMVNPYDIIGTAEVLKRALEMPLEERRQRHQRLLQRIREQDVHWWRETFLDALASRGPDA
jgi:trehalose 6-phosphate synthase